MQVSLSTRSEPRRFAFAWLAAKAALVLVAIFLFSVLVAGLEMRFGIEPAFDGSTPWELGGE